MGVGEGQVGGGVTKRACPVGLLAASPAPSGNQLAERELAVCATAYLKHRDLTKCFELSWFQLANMLIQLTCHDGQECTRGGNAVAGMWTDMRGYFILLQLRFQTKDVVSDCLL